MLVPQSQSLAPRTVSELVVHQSQAASEQLHLILWDQLCCVLFTTAQHYLSWEALTSDWFLGNCSLFFSHILLFLLPNELLLCNKRCNRSHLYHIWFFHLSLKTVMHVSKNSDKKCPSCLLEVRSHHLNLYFLHSKYAESAGYSVPQSCLLSETSKNGHFKTSEKTAWWLLRLLLRCCRSAGFILTCTLTVALSSWGRGGLYPLFPGFVRGVCVHVELHKWKEKSDLLTDLENSMLKTVTHPLTKLFFPEHSLRWTSDPSRRKLIKLNMVLSFVSV